MIRSFPVVLLGTLLLASFVAACETPQPEDESAPLVIYSGRSEALIGPLIERFQNDTGTPVEVRYGDTAQLAVALTEEGDQSPAHVFWAQDAGALGAVQNAGLFQPLPDSLLNRVDARYRNTAGTWVATSGRARTLAYAPERVDTTALPQSIFDLTDPRYESRVGWAPTNGSFQAHVTALRTLVGDDSTRAWLEAMQANGATPYSNNRAILDGIAAGEVDFGLPNHYYLYGKKSDDPDYPVEQTFFAAGDPGNLVNVAGMGVLEATPAAYRFVDYVLSAEAQQYFADETYEYPVLPSVTPATRLTDQRRLTTLQPDVNLDALRDLETTLELLRDVGLL